MQPPSTHGLTDDELADLARLADGTLPPDRVAEVQARVDASPELTSVVEQQGYALDALRATADPGAPLRLRTTVGRRVQKEPRWSRRNLTRGAVAALAGAALAAVLVLPAGPPTVGATAALAGRPATGPAPAAAAGIPQLLQAEVDGVPFPNFAKKFGYRPVGARRDEISGRTVRTVYYDKAGRDLVYSIVAGDALKRPSGARALKRDDGEYLTFRAGDRTVITWRRGGQTCVLSSRTARPAELVTLADWRGKGAIPF